jgi:transcriptional regulator with XRE-family HTH domain
MARAKQVNKKKLPTKAKEKPGRKSKYFTHVLPKLNRIPKWRRDGMTEEQVAKRCGVAYSTFREYMKIHSALSAAIKTSREELIEELEDSLYKRAMGYNLLETKTESEGEGEERKITKIVTTTKHLPPDTGALIFALKNLKGDKWRNVERMEVSASEETSNILKSVVEQFTNRAEEVVKDGIDTLEE